MPCSRVADEINTHIEPAGDGRDHAEPPDAGAPRGDVGRDQRQRDLDLRIARAVAHPQAEPADGRANTTSPTMMAANVPVASAAKGAGRNRHHREAIQDQRGGVVPPRGRRGWRGSPSLRAIASGATTSGGATMAEREADAHGSRSDSVAAATAKAVKITQPTDSRMMGRKLYLNSRQLMATLAE